MPDLKSLAGRLFKLVFGWYLLLAIVVTAVQLGLEYSSIRSTIARDLDALGRSFAPGVTDALWTYDDDLMKSLARGIAQAAIVTGVKIENGRGEALAVEGSIPSGAPSDALLAPFQMHEVPLWSAVLAGDRDKRLLGRLVLYSDREVVVELVRYSFVVILINSLIKTAGLWLIFHWAITRRLSRPLKELSSAVARLDFKESSPVVPLLDYPHRDEIGALVASLNDMRLRLAERSAELQRANKELEDYSYSMSHDLRTPLRALDGYSKVLLEEYDFRLDEEGRRLLNGLRENAQRMARQMDDMLRFLHLGRQRIGYSVVDLGALATEIFAELQAASPGQSMRLQVGEMPLALGDRGMLSLALRNLLSNAVKFSPPDRETLIELTGAVRGEENVYTVTDHGIGFDVRYADKLFGIFERVHSATESCGAGIGLAIVKRIVERHGGRVWAEGKVDDGASFHFALPREVPEPSHRAAAGIGWRFDSRGQDILD